MDERLLLVESKHLIFRSATVDDVPLIFDLRHSVRGKILNHTSPDIADQYSYFESYKERFEEGREIYYVIRDKKVDLDVGIFRLTNIDKSICVGWEGLVIGERSSPFLAVDICASVYEMSFKILGRSELGPWKVRPDNSVMIKIHNYMKVARQISEIDNWLIYLVEHDWYISRRHWLHSRGLGDLK